MCGPSLSPAPSSSPDVTAPEAAIEDLLRQPTPQVLGAVVRRYRHVDPAEDATKEALLVAATPVAEGGRPRQSPCLADHGGLPPPA